jgi:hypothetical protein
MTTSFFTASETQSEYASRMNWGALVDRAVAGGDHFGTESPDLLNIPRDTVPERHHDLSIVPLRRLVDHTLVSYEEARLGIVCAKEIAGEEDPVLPEECQLGLRPVSPWRDEEFKRLIAKGKRFPVLDNLYPV